MLRAAAWHNCVPLHHGSIQQLASVADHRPAPVFVTPPRHNRFLHSHTSPTTNNAPATSILNSKDPIVLAPSKATKQQHVGTSTNVQTTQFSPNARTEHTVRGSTSRFPHHLIPNTFHCALFLAIVAVQLTIDTKLDSVGHRFSPAIVIGNCCRLFHIVVVVLPCLQASRPSSSRFAAPSLHPKQPCVHMSDTARGQPWRPPGRGSDKAKSGGGWREAEPMRLRNQILRPRSSCGTTRPKIPPQNQSLGRERQRCTLQRITNRNPKPHINIFTEHTLINHIYDCWRAYMSHNNVHKWKAIRSLNYKSTIAYLTAHACT